ncbi:MAG TPA: NUDIX domain-containing protein [Candidatus Paceibacterota bacterium]
MRVAQKVVVVNGEGKLLGLRRSAHDTNRPLTWDLPGGEIEEGENLVESAKREVREETGLEINDLKFVHADGRSIASGEYWIALFVVARALPGEVRLSDEHDQYQWFTREEFLHERSSDRIEEFLRDIYDAP